MQVAFLVAQVYGAYLSITRFRFVSLFCRFDDSRDNIVGSCNLVGHRNFRNRLLQAVSVTHSDALAIIINIIMLYIYVGHVFKLQSRNISCKACLIVQYRIRLNVAYSVN